MNDNKKPKRRPRQAPKQPAPQEEAAPQKQDWGWKILEWLWVTGIILITISGLYWVIYFGSLMALRDFHQEKPVAAPSGEAGEVPVTDSDQGKGYTVPLTKQYFRGTCEAGALATEVDVYVIPEFPERKGIRGMFIPSIATIALVDTDLNPDSPDEMAFGQLRVPISLVKSSS
jgi:hypothetical protein